MESVASIVVTVCCAAGLLPTGDPFDYANLVPPDVDAYLHIDLGGQGAGSLESTHLYQSIASAFEGSAIRDAWKGLAEEAGLSERDLFDTLLGESLTLALRRDGEGRLAWGAIAKVEDDDWGRLDEAWRLRILKPRSGMSIRRLPEHEMLFARRKEIVIFAPDPETGPSLFDDLLEQMSTRRDSLGRHDALRAARGLGDGHVGLYLRHEAPIGGWSAVVASLNGRTVEVRHLSQFIDAPFKAPASEIELDPSLLSRLSRRHIAAVVQSAAPPGGALALFIRAQMPQDSISDLLSRALGDRQFVVVSLEPADANEGDAGAKDTLACAFAFELDLAPENVAPEQDRFMEGVAAAIGKLGAGGGSPPAKPFHMSPGNVRSIDVGSDAKRLFPNIPGVERVSLNWTSASGGHGHWWIIASHPATAKSCADVLRQPTPPQTPETVAGQKGVLDPLRAKPVVEGLGATLVQLSAARGEDVGSIGALFDFITDLSDDMTSCEWTLSSPGANRLQSSWRIELRRRDGGR